jgi:hypothetical protein
MIAPSRKKNRIIQVDVTNRCDLACSNCTRMLAHHPKRYDMSVEVFRQTCRILSRALPNFIIGLFGGNPALHPQFEALCRVMREEIPNAPCRGLWCNHLRGHGKAAAETFARGYLNLNAHAVPSAVAEFKQHFGRLIPDSVDKPALHSSILVAMKDFLDEGQIWKLVDQCDIDNDWSGCVIEQDGKPYLYSCEIHAAFDLAYGENNGVLLTEQSVVAPIEAFAHQYRRWCPSCGIPLRLKGQRDCDNTDDYSVTHERLVQLRVKRKTNKVETLDAEHCAKATDYMRHRSK